MEFNKHRNPSKQHPPSVVLKINESITQKQVEDVCRFLPEYIRTYKPNGNKNICYVNFKTQNGARQAVQSLNGTVINEFRVSAEKQEHKDNNNNNNKFKKIKFDADNSKDEKTEQSTFVNDSKLKLNDDNAVQSNEKPSKVEDKPETKDNMDEETGEQKLAKEKMVFNFVSSFLKCKTLNTDLAEFYCSKTDFSLSKSFHAKNTENRAITSEPTDKVSASSVAHIVDILKKSILNSLPCTFEKLYISSIGNYSFSVFLNGKFAYKTSLECFRILTISYIFSEEKFKILSDHIHLKYYVD